MVFQSTQSKRRAIWIVTGLLGGGALLLHAFNPQPDPPKVFGIFGITPADVIRLNVTNVAGELGQYPPPCRARIGFVNAAGVTIKTSDVIITNGGSASIALNYFEASNALDALVPRNRVSVRPIINYTPPDPCFTSISAEIDDAITGRTNIYATPQWWMPTVATTLPGPQ